MKRQELIKIIEKYGCVLIRHGGKHDIYQNPETGISQPIPRHREINERLARKIVGSPLLCVITHAYGFMESFHSKPFAVIFSRLVITMIHFPHS
jgi:predicted RNA binding protein YcfA (HicA-like mRNA interferase family)